ncbi:Ig-like domain-containing protein [Vibrio europaeus]|uniref:Cadherin-like domain-containing protein n=1 Tax=Vibrio europaeus TaxID=300876 RepID=A0AAE7AZ29_9VIBR|nr:Ig-like domain-containing protein [Vibrio europaeus]MDC5805175.1 Ig-like domain-containing protein [Vibrio europaeus]MDC5811521.1 Ig-like domain-containing protein [Vibrio europaeus]MDC5826750.1 Ig-like domain-containing protein [Vibrio europaeus]MDC5832116.1 Ig-like domain-containing protein [Vibrio europaeus]MDC5835071.1 Ig-like domain-containing protein [Vibrio europaeus]
MKLSFSSVLLSAILLLYGCGGEGGSEPQSNTDIDNISSPIAVENFAQLSLQDGASHTVSLKNSVSDPAGLPLTLESVTSLSSDCEDPQFDSQTMSFQVDKNTPKTCLYQYVVQNHSDTPQFDKTVASRSYVLLSETTTSAVIPPLSEIAQVNDSLSISLEEKLATSFPANYGLDEQIVVLGGGSASADVSTNTIQFQAGSEVGVSRLIYSMTSVDGTNVKAGYIDIAVSERLDGMPTAENFAGPEDLLPESTITIDVAEHIQDPDGDILQLTEVYSYNAQVSVADENDPANTRFTFSAKTPGTYDVSYYVTDHNGGFAVATVRLTVAELAKPWQDIVLANSQRYTAPWEKQSADVSQLYYQGIETEVINSTDYDISLFDHNTTSSLCLSRGMVLPTSEQMEALFTAKPDIASSDHWPVAARYWTSSSQTATSYQSIDMSTGVLTASSSTTPLIATCVYPGDLSTQVIKDKAYVTHHGEGDFDQVQAKVVGKDGAPLINQQVYAYADSRALQFDHQGSLTDASGLAIFNVSSDAKGPFKVFVNYYSQTLETVANFIDDTLAEVMISGQQTLYQGDSASLQAIGSYQSGYSEDVTNQSNWQSSESSTVPVNQQGEITAVKVGTATVSTSLNGVHSNGLLITVKPLLTALVVEPDSLEIKVGASKQLVATAHYSDNSTKVVTALVDWSSSDSSKASVDGNGLVKGKVEGTVTIHASYKDGEVTQTATVYPVNVYVPVSFTSLTVSPTSATLAVGKTQAFTATAHYSDGSTKVVTSQSGWVSSNSGIASVSGTGVVTGKKAGNAKLTVTYSDLGVKKSASATVTVKKALKSVTVTPTSDAIVVGGSTTLKAQAHYDDGSVMSLTTQAKWTSSNSNIATVNASGVVSGKAAGRVTIQVSYTDLGITKSAVSTVNVDPDSDYDGASGAADSDPRHYNSLEAYNKIGLNAWVKYFRDNGDTRAVLPVSERQHFAYFDGSSWSLQSCGGSLLLNPETRYCEPPSDTPADEAQRLYEQNLPLALKKKILSLN